MSEVVVRLKIGGALGCSHRLCQRCHSRLDVWNRFSSSLVTSLEPMKMERTHFYHTHIPLGRTNSLSDHNLKSAESLTGSEQLSSVSSGVSRRLGPGTGFMPHVVRRLIKMIGHWAPGHYWQWDSIELVSTIINWKLFSTLSVWSLHINHDSNKREFPILVFLNQILG